MAKLLRTLFFVLSVVLVVSMIVACVAIIADDTSSDSDAASSVADSSDATSFADSSESEESSVPDSSESEESFYEESSEETSEDESSEDESSEDEDSSDVGDSADSDPIVTAPDALATSEIDAFFDDSVFVGHSVMVHFSSYVSRWRSGISNDILGNARFCCTSNFSFYNNQTQTPDTVDNVLPKFRGTAYNIEDLPGATGCSTVYLGLMGLNDLGMCSSAAACAEETAARVAECIEAIKANSPDVNIVVLSSTYLTRSTQHYSKLNNKNMRKLNKLVLDYCNANGVDFIDVATPLTDGDGYLADVYSSDNYCHLTQSAYYIWMDALRDYASSKQAGTWSNPDGETLFG